MTPRNIIFFGLLLWLILAAVKVVFLKNLDFDSLGVYSLFLLISAAVGIACSRRLGAINLMEAVAISFGWLVFVSFFDYVITNRFLPEPYFDYTHAFASYGVLFAAVFLSALFGLLELMAVIVGVLALFLFVGVSVGYPSVLKPEYVKQLWMGHFAMTAGILIFHKMKHRKIRHELHAPHGHQAAHQEHKKH